MPNLSPSSAPARVASLAAGPHVIEAPPGHPAELPLPLAPGVRPVCAAIRQLTEELYRAIGGMGGQGVDRRRALCHVRQISMYVCHVSLGLSFTDIGRAFGRDRTTVAHACQVVEDRRDDKAYDGFVAALERVAARLVEEREGFTHG